MTKHSDPVRSRALWLGCVVLALGATACSGGGGGTAKQPNNSPGEVVDKPGGGFFFADFNQNGNGQEIRILRQASGRLVEVFGLDFAGERVPMASDWVIDPNLDSDGQNYVLETNPVTSQQLLVILQDVTDESTGGGLAQFYSLLFAAEAALSPIFDNDAQGAGVYSMIPRNSAVVVQFDDLIDEQSLTPITFRVRTGNPPVLPFEARVMLDPNHGDVADHDGLPGIEFYSTRMIVDTTVSVIESFSVDPPLAVNGVGLPPAVDVSLANFEVRIPTEINLNVGQNKLLTNPSGHSLTTNSNGPVDFSSGTADVVRAARSGGPESLTADPFNGFLPDDEQPLVVGRQLVTIAEQPLPFPDIEDMFWLPKVLFHSEFCSQTPSPGDTFTQTGLVAEVILEPQPVQNGELNNVLVRLLLFPLDWVNGPREWLNNATGDAQYLSAFDPQKDVGMEACFVRVAPTPSGFPADPTKGIDTSAVLSVRFSEPMDPDAMTAFDSLTLTRAPVPGPDEDPLSTNQYVVGTLGLTLDLQEFSFVPDLPLAHQLGEEEPYYLTVTTGALSPTDLAGNGLAVTLPAVAFTVDPTAAEQRNGGRVSRFTSLDEEPPVGDEETGPIPEWSGQHLYDLGRQTIRPRPVVRFLSTTDRSKPVPQLMTPFTPGVQTPLSGLGSKMQTAWRYVDHGMALTDATSHNMDIEGLYWTPVSGAVVADSYPQFQMRIAHCAFAPDEYIDPGSLFPRWSKSGLGGKQKNKKFSGNFLDKTNDAPKVIHPKPLGYQVSPGELIVDPASGTKLMPYPWNRTVSSEDWKTWTWRNTAVRKRGGPNIKGVDPQQLWKALGLSEPCNVYYGPGNVRTIGLPMLVEFRCYPDGGAVGQNSFDISLASNSSSMPYFRAFSTGGVDTSGNIVTIDPDTEQLANGGFNPNANGAPTFGLDNSFYIGAADFVVRISRSHSIWFPATNPFDADGQSFNFPLYMDPIVEPRPESQPDGTSVTLAFRGARKMNEQTDFCGNEDNLEWTENALSLDTYGDHYFEKCIPQAPWCPDPCPTFCVSNHNPLWENRGIGAWTPDSNWHEVISEIDEAKYYQVRATFEADIFTGLVPELSAVAVSWVAQ